MCTRVNVSGRFHNSQNENDMNYKSSRCIKFLVFVLRRSLCWFSLNYVNKSDLKMNTILDNAGLGFGRKGTRLVVTGLQHCLVSEILKETYRPPSCFIISSTSLQRRLLQRRLEFLLTIRNLRKNYIQTNIDVKHVC